MFMGAAYGDYDHLARVREWSVRRRGGRGMISRRARRPRAPSQPAPRPIPAVSAWVSANAGSGKTHGAGARVIRLLLARSNHRQILCLTFTKAAAANMANRIFDTLGHWTALEDEAREAIEGITGARPDIAGLRRRRGSSSPRRWRHRAG